MHYNMQVISTSDNTGCCSVLVTKSRPTSQNAISWFDRADWVLIIGHNDIFLLVHLKQYIYII